MRFPFKLPEFCPPLSPRIKDGANHPGTEIVEMGNRYGDGHKISTEPLFTYQVFNCNVVVLFSGNYVGMSHYPGFLMDPKTYLPKFIDEVRCKSEDSDITAVPIAGDEIYHSEVKKVLRKQGIKITDEFCDDLDTILRNEFSNAFLCRLLRGFEPPGYEGITGELGEKFVLAIPYTRELLLYSSATKVGSKILTTR